MNARTSKPVRLGSAFGALFIVSAAQAFGCTAETSGPSVDPIGDEPAAAVAENNLLYSLELGPDHEIQFWEFPGNVLATEETTAVGSEDITSRVDVQALSLEQFYRLARPSARDVPQVLLEADARRAAAERDRPVIEAEPERATTLMDDASKQSDVLPTAALSAASACSPDVYGDNYGSEWFFDRYCPVSQSGICRANYEQVTVGPTGRSFKWTVMAADFATGADTRASYDYWDCTTLPASGSPPGTCYEVTRTVANTYIAPRAVKSWTLSGGNDYRASATGRSPCKKVHIAAMYR